MSEEWGPWIEHDGRGCPCPGRYVRCLFENPDRAELSMAEGIAGSGGGWSWNWKWFNRVPPGCHVRAERVLRYRIRKPRGLTMLEEIAKGVKQPEDA